MTGPSISGLGILYQYFFLLDSRKNQDDPTQCSRAGKFKKSFPKERPNYFTDDNGTI